MINFISTFPPIMCGIGAYTKNLVTKMPKRTWKVTSPALTTYLKTDHCFRANDLVAYEISLSNPHLPASLEADVVWFQHAFGMWGRGSPTFHQLVEEAKGRKKKVIATFHTIHFESDETDAGMRKAEEELLQRVLPCLDAATVFSDGAYQAVTKRFPEYQDRIVVLRHGVPLYPHISKKEAREKLLRYLITIAAIPPGEKQSLEERYSQFFSPETILLGNFGFITSEKDARTLYELGHLVQDLLVERRIIVLFIGVVQKRADRKVEECLPLLQELRTIHDGNVNLFFEDYIPDEVFPYAFRALDFCVFWCENATQSGRMAHAQGTGSCVVGRRIEGLGETLDIAGSPSGVSLQDMACKIASVVLEPRLEEEVRRSSWHYAQRVSFQRQAYKHLVLEDSVRSGSELPVLDRTRPVFDYIVDKLYVGKRDGLESPPREITAFLNVADDVDLFPLPARYHKIPLVDGMPAPVERMVEACRWIQDNIVSNKVLVFCRYGRGRSASVIIGYLCSIGFHYEEAVKLVTSKRPDVNPLPNLEESIRKALAQMVMADY